jgi:hypothetical protein
MKEPEKNIQVYLSIFFGFFHFQSGALEDVAQQNPIRLVDYYPSLLEYFFRVFSFSKRRFGGCCAAKS